MLLQTMILLLDGYRLAGIIVMLTKPKVKVTDSEIFVNPGPECH